MQEKVDLKPIVGWLLKKWSALCICALAVACGLVVSQYGKAQKKYDEAQNEYTIEQCESSLSVEEVNTVKLLLALDENIAVDNEKMVEYIKLEPSQEQISEDIDFYTKMGKQRELRNYVWGSLNEVQLKYFYLLAGYIETSVSVPQITVKMVVFCGLLGIICAIALGIAWYLFSGYLHSGREIVLNFDYPYYLITKSTKDIRHSVDLMEECFQCKEKTDFAFIQITNKRGRISETERILEEDNKIELLKYASYDNAIQDNLKNVKRAVLVTKVNNTKLKQIVQIGDLLTTFDISVAGVLVIEE